MRVAAEVRGPVKEPYLQVHQENSLGMLLRAGSMELGLRRSAMRRVTFEAGEMGLCTPHSEQWIGSADMEHLTVSVSDAAFIAACDGVGGNVELRPRWKLLDARLGALLGGPKCREGYGISKWSAVSGFSGAGACRGVGQRLCSARPLFADVPRRAGSRARAKD